MKYNKFCLGLCALVAVAATSCQSDNENAHHYDNKVFISASGFANEVRIEKEVDAMSRQVTIGIAKPEKYDVTVTFKAAPAQLDTYRLAYYDPNVELLPEMHYDLSQAQAVIKEGKVASDPLTLDFTKLEELDLTKRYVLPVTIGSVNGLGVLKSANTIYYIFKEASLVNVVADIYDNRVWPDWKNAAPVTDMETFTLEALVMSYKFNRVDEKGNNITNPITTIMGIEDSFLVRVGDVTTSKDQLEVAYAVKTTETTLRGKVTDPSLKLQPNTWYHIAVTFDRGLIKLYLNGKLKASGNSASATGVSTVNFGVPHSEEDEGKPRCFWVGYSYDKYRYLNGQIGEVRIWNKALTEAEINVENHFYRVDPASEGLVSYWKFNDSEVDPATSGLIVKDYSIYGNDMTAQNKLKWQPVELPEKKN